MSDPLAFLVMALGFWALGFYVTLMRLRLKAQLLERIEGILDKFLKGVEEK